MLKNYLKTGFRNIVKYKNYSFITVAGFSISMACCLIILLYIQFELSYDRYHEHPDNLYRLVMQYERGGREYASIIVPGNTAEALRNNFNEISSIARLFTYTWREEALVSSGNENFYEKQFFIADQSILDIFSVDFIYGNRNTALSEVNCVILSESTAKKYFGNANPIGALLTVKNMKQTDLKVTGVIKDMPLNSHFKGDLIASFATGNNLYWDQFGQRPGSNFYLYLRTAENTDPDNLQAKISSFLRNINEDKSSVKGAVLQPVAGIHLHSHYRDELEQNGSIGNIYFFAVIAFVLIIISAVNFINLSTARSVTRAKEVGLRKVLGANRTQLVRQFIGESLFLSFVSVPFAFVLAELLIPAFSSMIGRETGLHVLDNAQVLIYLIGVIVLTGFVSGLYPALFISRYESAEVLKGSYKSGKKGVFSRNILVIAQFAVSIFFMICMAVVYNQMNFIRTNDAGYTKDQILVLSLKDYESTKTTGIYIERLLKNSLIKSASVSGALPSRISGKFGIHAGYMNSNEDISMYHASVDQHFLETYGIKLVSGRNFSSEYATDEKEGYIINRAAAKVFGWDEPLGETIQLSNKRATRIEFTPGTVIGMVDDFHFRSYHDRIEPLVMNMYPLEKRYLSIKINGANVSGAVAFARKTWRSVNPGRPFEYFFFDDNFNRMYKAEQQVSAVFLYSSLFTVLIACLGLFGLASFSISQRKKELSIRKVLGASVRDIVLLLSRDFTRLVVLANVLAWPAGYFIMKNWLDNFAYRDSLNVWMFAAASVAAFLIAFFTVSFQSVSVARENAVRTLKNE